MASELIAAATPTPTLTQTRLPRSSASACACAVSKPRLYLQSPNQMGCWLSGQVLHGRRSPLICPIRSSLAVTSTPTVEVGREAQVPSGQILGEQVKKVSSTVLASTATTLRTSSVVYGRKRMVEKLWQDLFSDPSKWWDHRLEKSHSRYPDFKHKETKQSLWLTNNLNPPWVQAELAAMVPGTIQVNIFAFNKKLERYVKSGQYWKAMEFFQEMKQEGMIPDKFTFVPVLNACSKLRAIEEGKQIHLELIQSGHESDLYVANSLVDMYCKCACIEEAQGVFDNMPSRGVVAWNAMILGYVKCEQGHKALELLQEMQRNGVDPDAVTFKGLLNACATLRALEQGRYIHEQIIQSGFESDVCVGSSLIDMYAKCGSIEDAERVFNRMPSRNVVSWSTMILGYVKSSEGWKALELFQEMLRKGVDPNPGTFVAVLKACATIPSLERGLFVHEQILKRGYGSDVVVGNCLVDMYAKCGSLEDAERVFDGMPTRNVVAWTAMILGYVKVGEGQKALQLSRQMQQEGVVPNAVTFVGMLNACATVLALEEGRHVHEQIIDGGYESNVFVSNSLVDMYGKCGSIEDARKVFKEMPTRDLVSWNAMLAGYSRHGYAKEALEHFDQMCTAVQVNEVTFISLLSACSHAGLVDEGLHYFECMCPVYSVSPSLDHYACVIDLLGRASCLLEAEDLIKSMPFEADATVLKTLLNACSIHVHVEMGQRIARRVLELDDRSAAGYVLLSNIYAAAGQWDSSEIFQQARLGKFCE